MNEFFIYSEVITLGLGYLKGWRIFKVTAAIFGPKILSRTRVQGSLEGKRSGNVDCQQVGSID